MHREHGTAPWFKFSGGSVDYRTVSRATVHPHHVRAAQGDLMAFARYWEWERTVTEHLPRLIDEGGIRILFQPIFRLVPGGVIAGGYEAWSRFPLAPRIPVGLWYRTARRLSLGPDLELAAVRAAVECFHRIPEGKFLSVNASLESVPGLVELIPADVEGRLMVDVPYSAINDPRAVEMFHLLRKGGARIAIDDVPLDDLHLLRSDLRRLRPDCIKVDVLIALVESSMARFNLAEGSAWCKGVGIGMIAERVERVEDLAVLEEVGVEWAQGYCLARPKTL